MFAEVFMAVMAAAAAAAAVALTAYNFAPRRDADEAADYMNELVPAPFTATLVPRYELVMP